MSTVQSLAREFGMQEYELRAFADDLLDRYETSTEEIDPQVERTIREAIAQSNALDA